MAKGKVWPAEWKRFVDRLTGQSILQLTDFKTHSYHLYFTEYGWYEQGNKLLFISDRENSTNLYSIHLGNGEITQLTDYMNNDYLDACLHPIESSVFIKIDDRINALDLGTLKEETMYKVPEGYKIGNLSCTSDGKYLVTCIQEDMSQRIELDLGNGYVGHRELMEAAPISKIIKIQLDSGKVDTLYEENNFITHINVSPTEPWLMTFCHEGPWHLVDHRIWGLDMRTGESWKIRERFEPKEKVGHEFFYPDGVHIGYHGFRENGANFFGKIRYDNTGMEEHEFPFDTWHAHSDGLTQTVVDGKGNVKTLSIWRKSKGIVDGPRVLCELRCSFHSQKVHAHPQFEAGGKRLLFTSDKSGYANLYLVDIPENFESLPMLSI